MTEERRAAVDEDDEVDEEHERRVAPGAVGWLQPPRGNGVSGQAEGGRKGGEISRVLGFIPLGRRRRCCRRHHRWMLRVAGPRA